VDLLRAGKGDSGEAEFVEGGSLNACEAGHGGFAVGSDIQAGDAAEEGVEDSGDCSEGRELFVGVGQGKF
jgi:hypothetical protein